MIPSYAWEYQPRPCHNICKDLNFLFFSQKWEAMWALSEAAGFNNFCIFYISILFLPLTFLTLVPYAFVAFSWCVDEWGGSVWESSGIGSSWNWKAGWGGREGTLAVLPNMIGEEGNKTSIVSLQCMIRWWYTTVRINWNIRIITWGG